MSKNNKLEEFCSLFSNDIIKKSKPNEEFGNSGLFNISEKPSGNHFDMFSKFIKKETNNFDNKTLLDKQHFKTNENFFKNDWNKTQWKLPNNIGQNNKFLVNQSSPKRSSKFTQDTELSDKLTFPTLFSSPERQPSKITVDNNKSQKQSTPTILSYFKERKKILNSENRCSPRKNDKTHNSWNDNFWPKPSNGILQPSNTQTSKHFSPAKRTPNAKEKTRKSPDLKRLVGSKFTEIMAQNRKRQRGIENYLKSFNSPEQVESKNDLRSSQVSTNWMDLQPPVSQKSCKLTQKGK